MMMMIMMCFLFFLWKILFFFACLCLCFSLAFFKNPLCKKQYQYISSYHSIDPSLFSHRREQAMHTLHRRGYQCPCWSSQYFLVYFSDISLMLINTPSFICLTVLERLDSSIFRMVLLRENHESHWTHPLLMKRVIACVRSSAYLLMIASFLMTWWFFSVKFFLKIIASGRRSLECTRRFTSVSTITPFLFSLYA